MNAISFKCRYSYVGIFIGNHFCENCSKEVGYTFKIESKEPSSICINCAHEFLSFGSIRQNKQKLLHDLKFFPVTNLLVAAVIAGKPLDTSDKFMYVTIGNTGRKIAAYVSDIEKYFPGFVDFYSKK